MSSDRLFCVRAQQPYASGTKTELSLPTKTPVCVCSTISVGNLSVFVGCEEEFKIGKILQFSYYQEKTKKSQQYHGLTISISENQGMGILCCWYVASLDPRCFSLMEDSIHSYVPSSRYLCTLTASDGCFEDISSTRPSSSSIICTPQDFVS